MKSTNAPYAHLTSHTRRDRHHGFYGKTPTDLKSEIGNRSGQECEQIYSGKPVERYLARFILLMPVNKREKLNGHDAGHPRCGWGDVLLGSVILTQIIRVSVSSWQLDFFLERPLVSSEATAFSL